MLCNGAREQAVRTELLNSIGGFRPANRSALDQQVGGSHYKKYRIQPVEFIMANNIGYMEGNVIKYVVRHKDKGGIADLEKAMHYLQMLIEQERKQLKGY